MDFIMEHGTLFISIGVITLLALIGYYADKKESKNKEEVKNTSEPVTSNSTGVNSSDVLSNNVLNSSSTVFDGFSSVSSIPVDNQSNVRDDSDGVIDNSPFSLFTSSSFENVNMSLDDLEKKNYEKIASDKVDSDDYYYDDLDDAPSIVTEDLSDSNISLEPLFDNSFVDIKSNEDENLNDSVQESNPVLDEVVPDPVDHEFDEEIQPVEQQVVASTDGTLQSDVSTEVESTDSLASESNSDSVVSNNYDLKNNTDDIWKF